MGQPVIEPATYEDLKKVPPHMVAEIINGALVTQPRPRLRHARASSALGGELMPPFDRGRGGPGGWWILDEPELHLGEHVLVPDLAGWRHEHLPVIPDKPWLDLAPDWICEVISPSTARYDRLEKRNIYAQFKVPHLWLIEPDRRMLEAFELQKGQWSLIATHVNDDEIAIAPFAEVPFSLGALWAD